MVPIEKLKLSQLCDKDLKELTPCSSGFHCATCDKKVIDFRRSDLTDLTESLRTHGTLCGIFAKTQVQQTNISTKKYGRIAAGILIAIGFGVFSEDLKAQIQPVDSTVQKHRIEEESEIFIGTVVETMPTYLHGGEKGLMEFLGSNIKYQGDQLQGTVFVTFTIDTTGKPTNLKILRGLSEDADKEVIRVVEMLEFIPATQRGKKVAIQYNLPITFTSETNKKKKKQSR